MCELCISLLHGSAETAIANSRGYLNSQGIDNKLITLASKRNYFKDSDLVRTLNVLYVFYCAPFIIWEKGYRRHFYNVCDGELSINVRRCDS